MSYFKRYLAVLIAVIAIVLVGRLKLNNSGAASTGPASSSSTPVNPSAIIATPAGNWKDGTYTGQPFDAYYGLVQVQITISDKKITNLSFLSFPQENPTSSRINSRATPTLKNEVIQNQSASVNAVSGASFTSAAFNQSLNSALSQAQA